MKSSIRRHSQIFQKLLVLFICTIPLNNCLEILAMMRGTLTANTDVLTPIYFKFFKDALVVASVLLLSASSLKSLKSLKIYFSPFFLVANVFVLIMLLTSIYSLFSMPASIVLMGIRGYWSIVFLYVGAAYYDIQEEKLFPFLLGIFVLHFLLQIAQFFTKAGLAVYYEMRSPGIFVIPATAGAFALLLYYYAIRYKSTVLKLFLIVSLLLSNSTTGILILVVYYVYSYKNHMKPKFIFYPLYFIAIGLGGFFIVTHIGAISGRGGGASFSFLTRIAILYNALTNWRTLLFGMGMGVATSQALLTGYPTAVIADNTIIGILYNAGFLPAILMFILIFMSARFFEDKFLFFLFLGYSITMVFFEMSPIVQVILVFLGAHFARRYRGISQHRLTAQPSSQSLLDLEAGPQNQPA